MSSLKHISTDTQTQIDLPWKLIRFGISAYDCECNFPFAQLYVANNSTQIACKNKLLHFAIYKFHIVGSISTCNNRWQHTHRWTLFTLEKLGLKQKKIIGWAQERRNDRERGAYTWVAVQRSAPAHAAIANASAHRPSRLPTLSTPFTFTLSVQFSLI